MSPVAAGGALQSCIGLWAGCRVQDLSATEESPEGVVEGSPSRPRRTVLRVAIRTGPVG